MKLSPYFKDELTESGDRVCLRDTASGRGVSLAQTVDYTGRVASGLWRRGFRPGHVLQTGYSSCLDFYWPVFGAWRCGGTVSLGDPGLAPHLIRAQLLDTSPKVVVCSKDYVEK